MSIRKKFIITLVIMCAAIWSLVAVQLCFAQGTTVQSFKSPLAIVYGGTNATSFTSGYLPYYNGTRFVGSPVYTDGANIGIGTNNTTNGKFTVVAGDNKFYISPTVGYAILQYSSYAQAYFGADSTASYIGTLNNYPAHFIANGINRLDIDNTTGRVQIGSLFTMTSANIGTPGTVVGALFGYKDDTYQKGGIFFESVDANGRGKLHLAVNTAASAANASIADARLTIGSDGKVGIGTTAPGTLLDIHSTTAFGGAITIGNNAPYLVLHYTGSTEGALIAAASDANNFVVGSAAGDMIVRHYGGKLHIARDPSNIDMTISSNGNVGIGTTDPDSYSGGNSISPALVLYHPSISTRLVIDSGAANSGIRLSESGAMKWSIASYGGGSLTFYDDVNSRLAWNITSAGQTTIYSPNPYAPTLNHSDTVSWMFNASGGYITGSFNTTAPYAGWLQSRSAAGALPLSLNPLGGNVGIGTANPITLLEIPGSTTNSSFKVGAFEIQSYAVNNGWLGDNIYFNGTNFILRAAGYGVTQYFSAGGFQIRTIGSGAAGAEVDPVIRFRIANDGKVVIGSGLPTSILQVEGLVEYADNTAALAASLTAGAFYRTGDLLKVVH